MAEAARLAASLGLVLRDVRRDFPHADGEDLLDFIALVVNEAFDAPPSVNKISVMLTTLCEAPRLRKPETVQ
jgi:hypothetical protein